MNDSFPRALTIAVIAQVIASLVAAFVILAFERNIKSPQVIIPRDRISNWVTRQRAMLQRRKPKIMGLIRGGVAFLALAGVFLLVNLNVQSDNTLIVATSVSLLLVAYLTRKVEVPPMNLVGPIIILLGGVFGLGVKYLTGPLQIAESGVIILALTLWFGFLTLLWVCCAMVSDHITRSTSAIQAEFDLLARSTAIKRIISTEQERLLREVRRNWSKLKALVDEDRPSAKNILIPYVPVKFEFFKLYLGCKSQTDIDRTIEVPDFGFSFETTLDSCLRQLLGLDHVKTTYCVLSEEEFRTLESLLLEEQGITQKPHASENSVPIETARHEQAPK